MVKIKLTILTIMFFYLTGCTSFSEGLGRGIASAILDKTDEEDSRGCYAMSSGFKGIGQSIDKQKGKTKVLMVHGIGHHQPGYSTLLMENLAKELGLDGFASPQKNITLTDLNNPKKHLGNLRLTKLIDTKKNRELLFYELTWSSISQKHKEILTFDQSGLVEHRRAKINNLIKKLTNDALSDPMIYLGSHQEDIQVSVSQSYCWMIASDYSSFPDGAHKRCELKDKNILQSAKKDDFIFISHSLGSGITIDAMQRIARLLNTSKWKNEYPEISELHEVLQKREITLFMLANQLQLLQLGRDLPEVRGQIADYCRNDGLKKDDRFADKTNIIAISDPNDVLSYAIPQRYKDKFLDSRLCPDITNININIANSMNLFNMAEMANPVEAHTSYNNDDRVIALLAYGLGNNETRDIVNNRCEWIKTVQ